MGWLQLAFTRCRREAYAVLTTNTTQLTIDLAALIRGRGDPEDLAGARWRARLTFPSVAGFVVGCAAGSFLEVHFGLKALALPFVLAAIAVPLGERFTAGHAEAK